MFRSNFDGVIRMAIIRTTAVQKNLVPELIMNANTDEVNLTTANTFRPTYVMMVQRLSLTLQVKLVIVAITCSRTSVRWGIAPTPLS